MESGKRKWGGEKGREFEQEVAEGTEGERSEDGGRPDSCGLQSAAFCLQTVFRRISLGLRLRWQGIAAQ
jgi:hypothetical protein